MYGRSSQRAPLLSVCLKTRVSDEVPTLTTCPVLRWKLRRWRWQLQRWWWWIWIHFILKIQIFHIGKHWSQSIWKVKFTDWDQLVITDQWKYQFVNDDQWWSVRTPILPRIKTNVAPVFLHPRPLSLIRNALHTIHKRVYLQMTKCIHQSVEMSAQMEMVRCRDARKIPSKLPTVGSSDSFPGENWQGGGATSHCNPQYLCSSTELANL